MEYGLGLTFIGKGLENALGGTRLKVWRLELSLSAILRTKRLVDITFGARKLSAKYIIRTSHPTGSPAARVYSFSATGVGRQQEISY